MEKPNTPWWQPSISMFAELSGWILLPAVTAFFIGHYLDKKYNTGQWWFLGCVGISFIISIIGIVRGSVKAIKLMDKLSKKDK